MERWPQGALAGTPAIGLSACRQTAPEERVRVLSPSRAPPPPSTPPPHTHSPSPSPLPPLPPPPPSSSSRRVASVTTTADLLRGPADGRRKVLPDFEANHTGLRAASESFRTEDDGSGKRQAPSSTAAGLILWLITAR